MENQRIILYDTTLRDGTQGGGLILSVDDKLRIVKRLDALRFDYIEGGWPGSNPRDEEFFRRARDLHLDYAKLAAFGSTRRKNARADSDENLRLLIEANTPVVTIFGKSSEFQVKEGLETTPKENLNMIADSVAYLRGRGKEVVYDAEHFFDGFRANIEYAIATLQAAKTAGANWLVLCDTNGGTDFDYMRQIIREVKGRVQGIRYGIHTHNDSDYATTNAMIAVKEGFEMVQGTINGYGERIGNANLINIIVNAWKKGYMTNGNVNLSQLTNFYNFLCDVANLIPNPKQPFVGTDAFAHKGGIHVSAVLKNPGLYEHIEPQAVGNERRFYVTDLAGTSNIQAELGIDRKDPFARELLHAIKTKEHEGYSYETAGGSLELLLRRLKGEKTEIFSLLEREVIVTKSGNNTSSSFAVVKIGVNGDEVTEQDYGDGPVHALDLTLRKALMNKFPELKDLKLEDYKTRIISGEKTGTASKVRVLIESSIGIKRFGTVGVSGNIIDASWEALVDSYEYAHYFKTKSASEESITFPVVRS